jgi:calcineurin-like phosphoesterase family protein
MDRFIGDIHFSHSNILAYDNRPFNTPDENNKTIIDRWNDTVNITDTTYILGDVSHDNVTKTTDMINQLNGNKILVVGNHDKRFLKNKFFRDAFIEICDYKELDIENGKKLILCHYPIPCFNGQFYGNIHLYAHVHNTQQWNMIEYFKRISEEERGEGTCRMYNCGCMLDYMDFTPRTLNEILNTCEGKDVLSTNQRNGCE